jgi:uncharacterized membrane protein YcaP (DUF421 family)
MFNLTSGVGELIVRAAIVYIFLFLLFRFGGKKHVGEMAPFDFVVLLIFSESVNGALLGDEKSVTGGLISAATLIAIVHAVNYVSWYSKKAERLFEGVPKVLVRHGRMNREVMAEEKVTPSELIEALRREGHSSLEKVRFAVLENDGTITVGFRLKDES